jgi:glutamyl-tRNA synthetase
MVRTRFAPSPTGYMHIGNLRTALYAYCIAKHSQGRFLLRIEDTDRKRNVPKAIQVIYDSLKLAGLAYDEGPDKDGGYGPYVQSQRKVQGIYQHYADLLVGRGAAYRCFCGKPAETNMGPAPTKEGILMTARGKSPSSRALRDPCCDLPEDEVKARLAAGEPYVIRQRIPREGTTTFHDLVFGGITVKNSTLDEQVLLKSDGFPTYNFANVVDDHLMGITHVVRGVEYLSSTPKYDLLYKSFGWEIPAYIHLPHIVKESGKKLSKRAGDASFQDLIAQGFLPEAIINYIALLGWSPANDREFFTLPELVELFNVAHINKSKAAFSIQKLEWLNGEHIRQLAPGDFHAYAADYYPARLTAGCDTAVVSRMIQTRVTRLGAIPEMTQFLVEVAPYDLELYTHAKSKSTLESSLQVLKAAVPIFARMSDWNEENIRQMLVDYAGQANLKTGTVMWPIRVALSGLQNTPGGALEIAAVLGKAETIRRVEAATAKIQGS